MNNRGSIHSHFAARARASGSADRNAEARRLLFTKVAAGVVGAQFALTATALGIGEPQQLSNLFEPLRVDIPIESELGDAELRVRLSLMAGGDETGDGAVDARLESAAAQAPGLQQQLLNDGDGRRLLRVTTRSAIREPVLTLHLEVSAGGGLQLRRDLTLLLDPPTATAATAATASPFVARTEEQPLPQRTAEVTRPIAARPPPAVAQKQPSPPVRVASGLAPAVPAGWRISFPARAGETLEQIATRLRPSAATPVAEMAQLLRELNPNAFESGGDLRLGAQLRFPGPERIHEALSKFASSTPPVVAAATVRTDDAAAVTASAAASDSLRLADRLSEPSLRRVAEAQPLLPPLAEPAVVAAVPVLKPAGPSPAPVATAAEFPDSLFPAWLIAAAVLLSGIVLALLARILRQTRNETPARPPLLPTYSISAVAQQALIDELDDDSAAPPPSASRHWFRDRGQAPETGAGLPADADAETTVLRRLPRAHPDELRPAARPERRPVAGAGQ